MNNIISLSIMLLLFANAVCAQSVVLPSKVFDQLNDQLGGGGIGDAGTTYKVEIGPQKVLTLKIELTSHGDGVVRIGNLDVFVYDYNNNGSYYDGGLLKTEFVDLHGTGYNDVVISGMDLITGEKGDNIIARKPVCCILTFNPRTNTFRVAYKASDRPLITEVKAWQHCDALHPGLEDQYTSGPVWSTK